MNIEGRYTRHPSEKLSGDQAKVSFHSLGLAVLD